MKLLGNLGCIMYVYQMRSHNYQESRNIVDHLIFVFAENGEQGIPQM